MKTNKHGLSRDIPDDIKREVRQRCGFGCVVCGCALYEYHHSDPPFEDAISHGSFGIILLCPICHSKTTTGRLSKETITKAADNPRCLQLGFSYDPFDVGERPPTIVLGDATFIDNPIILEVYGQPLLQVEPPESLASPFRISALFCDKSGKKIAEIVRNEWQGHVKNWDIETVGKTTIIRSAKRKIDLVIRTEPPDKIVVEQLNMFYKGVRIVAKENESTSFYYPGGGQTRYENVAITGFQKGVVIKGTQNVEKQNI